MARRLPLVPTRTERRPVDVRLVIDAAHQVEVIEEGLLTAQTSVWIASANIKDLHVKSPIGTSARARGEYQSLFAWLADKAATGLDVRILHAARPSRGLAASPGWKRGGDIHRACPRVHLKMVAVDGRLLYLGSANFTGAGLGAKTSAKRNFEAGIVTDDPWMLDEMQRTFDEIWFGKHCARCALRARCPSPLDTQHPSGENGAPRGRHTPGTSTARSVKAASSQPRAKRKSSR